MSAQSCSVLSILSFLLLAGAAGSSQTSDPSLEHSETDVVSQPFYPAGYLDLKIAAALAEQDEDLHLFDGVDPASIETADLDYLDLSSCLMEFNIEESDPVEQILERTARTVARITDILKHASYDPRIYEEALLEYERNMLALAPNALAEPGHDLSADRDWIAYQEFQDRLNVHYGRLLDELERKRATIQPDRDRIAAVRECGAGETPYIVQTTPPNGRVWMVPMFRFLVCSRRFPDAWDRRSCIWWREYHADQPAYPWGRYVYQVQWPDGRTMRGDRSFAPPPQDSDFSTVTVTLVRN